MTATRPDPTTDLLTPSRGTLVALLAGFLTLALTLLGLLIFVAA